MSDTSDLRDQLARDVAQKALEEIHGHDRLCTERQKGLEGRLEAIKESITTLQTYIEKVDAKMSKNVANIYQRFWAIAISVIAALMGALGTMIGIFWYLKP